MIKYKTSTYRLEITAVEIVRETQQMVVKIGWKGREEKEMKDSQYHKYHDTYQDAVNSHVDRINAKIKNLQDSIDYETRELVKAKLLFDAEPPCTTTA